MKLSGLNRHILILVSVPLIAGISFVSVLLFLINSSNEKSKALELSLKRMAQAGRLSTAVYDLSKSTLVQSYPLSDYIARPIAECRKRVLEEKDSLVRLLKEQPGEPPQSRTRELDKKVTELVAQMNDLGSHQFMPNSQGVITEMGIIATKTDPVVELTNEIIESERRSEASKRDSVNEVQQTLNLTLLVGLLGVVAITVLLARALTEGIVRRIRVMKDNTRMLAARESLAPIDPSPDELGDLDRSFHHLAAELARLESRESATIQLASDMVVSFDRDFSIQFGNPSYFERFSEPESKSGNDTETGGSTFLKSLSIEERQRFEDLVDKHAISNGAFTTDLAMKTSSGHSLLVSCSATWSEQDKLFYCVLHDVTERRLLEDYRAKLLLMVGHDLRAPLSTLIIALEKVQAGEKDLSSSEASRLLTAAHYLRNLAESLLTAEEAQLGKLRLTLQPCSITALINEAILILRVHAEGKNIELTPEGEDFLTVSDKQKCVQVIVNLIENAIKYSEKSSQVLIKTFKTDSPSNSVANAASPDGFVRLEVVSTGSGLNEDDIPDLFQPFARGEEGKQRTTGYGLGLATAAQIVRAHGGDIGAENLTTSSGAIFWFTLPLCQFEEE